VLALELRVNAVARFASIELWCSDRSGNESARADVLAECSDASWLLHVSSHDLSGLDSDGVVINLEAVGSSDPADLGLTRLDIAALHFQLS
jgi:hypothetical protein